MRLVGFHHVCVQTDDYDASLDFYTRVLGFAVAKESRGFHGRAFNTWLRAGALYIELRTPKAGTRFRAWDKLTCGPAHVCLLVEDLEEAYRAIRAAGHARFKERNGEALYVVEGQALLKVIAPEGTLVELKSDPRL